MLDKPPFGHFQSKVYDWKVLEVACYSVMMINVLKNLLDGSFSNGRVIGPIGMESPQHPAARNRNFHWTNWKTSRCAIHTMTKLPGSHEKTPFIGFNGYLSVYQSM
jgi:hypothetical protein